MIRPVTCVCMLMAAGSGLYLYQAKHQAELVNREIRRLHAEADATRQRAGVMLAEYQLENDPERLGILATQFLPQLKPTAPTQFTTLADLDHRLPAVGEPAPTGQAPLEPDQPFAHPPTATAAASVPMASLDAPHGDAPREDTKADPSHAAATKPLPLPSTPAQIAAKAPAPKPPAAPPHPVIAAIHAPQQPYVPPSWQQQQPPQQVAAMRQVPIQQPQSYAGGPPMLASSQPNGYAAPAGVGHVPAYTSALGMARSMQAQAPVSSASVSTWVPGGN